MTSYPRSSLILRLRYLHSRTHRHRRHRPCLASLPPDYSPHPHPALPPNHSPCPHRHHCPHYHHRRRGRLHYPEMHNMNSVLKLLRT